MDVFLENSLSCFEGAVWTSSTPSYAIAPLSEPSLQTLQLYNLSGRAIAARLPVK
ncbi:MAG: hypothetical protein HC849_12010 [Oscillatoriales cyanobacterium RU_3_3]|nr:hypothetical protein [Oscillatoriales cyanobacterium RU_3_3]